MSFAKRFDASLARLHNAFHSTFMRNYPFIKNLIVPDTLLSNEAATENRKQKKDKLKNNKHSYEIDFSTAIKTTREYFHQDSSDHPIDIIRLLCKFMHVVKDEVRHFDRPLRGIGAVHFNYR